MTLNLETQKGTNTDNQDALHAEELIQNATSTTDRSLDGRILKRAKTLIIELKDILEQETNALKASDLKTAIDCQDQKIKLIKEYEQLIADARKNEVLLRNSKNEQKEDIRRMQGQLTTAIDQNRRALNNSKKAVERLTTRIMDTVRKCVKSEENVAYSASGTVASPSRGLSMKIDETL
jgi:hypothetical protein